MSKESLSNVDAAWYGMEDPTNLMMVSGILTFAKPINFDHFKAIIQHRWLKFDRFRKRVVRPRNPLKLPYWETDPHFELSAHVRRVALPQPGDQKTLQEMVSTLMSTPLDYSKPLWQFHIIENYGEGCALMGRLHHALADGMALMYVLLSMTDLTPDAPWPEAEEPTVEAVRGGYLVGNVIGQLVKQTAAAVGTARAVTTRLVDESREIMETPSHALDLAKQGTNMAVAAGRLVLRPSDNKTIFKGELGVAKLAAWSRPLPLPEIKRIKNVMGGTVNDVLVTAMTGGLRRYMQHREEPVDEVDFRATVPVNLRTPEEMTQLGNKFGLVYLSLPIYIDDVQARLQEVSERMTALKKSPEAMVAMGILSGIGMTPAEVQHQLVNMFGAKATAVMTNVPGPQFPLYLAGQAINGIMFWVPQAGRVGLGVSIISYAGQVWLGVATDAGLVPDPDKIIEGFYEEYEMMLALAQQPETAAEDIPIETAPNGRCQAMTKQGKPCQNRPLAQSSFCRVHQK